MRRNIFEKLYGNTNIPVIICEDDRDLSICFANAAAYILLNPALTARETAVDSPTPLRQLIRFTDDACFNRISVLLQKTGALNKYPTTLVSGENTVIGATLTANITRHLDRSYAVIYIYAAPFPDDAESDVSASVLEAASGSDAEDAIRAVFSIIGKYTDAGHIFALSSFPGGHIRKIYEWRSERNLPHADKPLSARKCNYDALTGTPGVYVANSLSLLSENMRPIPSGHDVKAIAIFRLSHQQIPVGYVAYESYEHGGIWRIRDLALFLSLSGIVASLVTRAGLALGNREVRSVPDDDTASLIYVNDIDNYELKLAGKSLAALLDTQPEELTNKPCWQALKKNEGGPCPCCPVPSLLELNTCPGALVPQNTTHDVCVWIDDSLVLWIDGVMARFNLAVDISLRKHYDERLLHIASVDAMTGVLNRKWGVDLLNNEHKTARITGEPMSLCFIDLDHLKDINDAFGHRVGDEMILSIADSIRRRVRRDDVVCRWGGDEFLVLLKCDMDNADTVISGIQSELCIRSGIRPELTFSYGIVDFTGFDCVDDAINAADQLMYADKNSKQKAR